MKTIRGRILLGFVVSTVVALGALALIVFWQLNSTVAPMVQEAGKEVISGRADEVANLLFAFQLEIQALSSNTDIQMMDWFLAEDVLKKEAASRENRYEMFFLATLDGTSWNTLGDQLDISDREYFQAIRNGAPFSVSNLLVSRTSGHPVVMVACPVTSWSGEVIGVLGASVKLERLVRAVSLVQASGKGYGLLLDGNGILIAHPEMSLVGSSFQQLSQGTEGFSEIVQPDGTRELVIHVPVPSTPGWTLGVVVNRGEMMQETNHLILVLLLMVAGVIAVMVVVSFLLGWRIAKPIHILAEGVQRFGERDLTVEFRARGKDEVARMAQALSGMASSLRQAMQQVSQSTSQVGTASHELSSVARSGERMGTALLQKAEEVDLLVQNTSASIEQVSSGVEEVAASAQNVSRMAQELASIAQEAEDVSRKGESGLAKVGETVERANEQTQQASHMVASLAENSRKVEEILETISSIAEQTNLLALNAAIEAARAGEAGKGFAVVADEIRKLAEESKQATGNIAGILKEIGNGSHEADAATSRTAQMVREVKQGTDGTRSDFVHILETVTKLQSMVENLAGVAQEQSASSQEMASAMDASARSMVQVTQQMEQVKESTLAQQQETQKVGESAGVLQELAETLEQLVKGFRL
ncbi:MAG TPA: methyl-accepting chemotaxis protein [Thermotogota bacterium]|nr:methyl-accepting chemotaxis protein [Thermotogota bacterium]